MRPLPDAGSHPREAQATRHAGHLRLLEVARGTDRVVDGRDHQVLEHLDVRRVDRVRLDVELETSSCLPLTTARTQTPPPAEPSRRAARSSSSTRCMSRCIWSAIFWRLPKLIGWIPSSPTGRRPGRTCRHGKSGTSAVGAQPAADQWISGISTRSSPHTSRAARSTAAPSGSASGSGSCSTLVATQRTVTGWPSTRPRPSSKFARRRSATSRRKLVALGEAEGDERAVDGDQAGRLRSAASSAGAG